MRENYMREKIKQSYTKVNWPKRTKTDVFRSECFDSILFRKSFVV